MSYAVCRMQKVKSAGLKGMQFHNQRERKSRTNDDIDHERTRENYDLKNDKNIDYNERVKEIIESQKTGTRKTRKDAVLVNELLVTSDRDFFEQLDPGEQKRFFEESYKLSVDKVNLSFLANASYVKNEIKNLGNQTGYIDKESLPTLGTVSRNQNGYPIGYFFGYKAIGVFQTQEEIDNYISPATGKPIQPNAVPGDTKFEDLNGDGVISDDNEDRTMIGKPNPDWIVGLTVAADWNGFDLSAFFQGSFGADVFDALRRYELAAVNYTSDALERWTGPGTSNSMPRIVLGDTPKNFRPSTLLVHDASFLRLRNLQVGYTLPAQLTRKAYIQRLRFYASFDNLLTITGYKGMDPEIGSTMGIDKGVYPQARVYTFGLNLTF